ncbi:hypothetical protein [Absidia glauca]|uniref:TLC domain-containing protein n=1 Tax=Absidia glauca TaxID=4829 RepID=A0A168QR15_ABSGL|nr:hypothetical protein [Absidia glauca]
MQTGLDGVLQQHQEAAVALTTFFLTFLVWDLVVGVCRYRSKIDPLTGWVHHTAYFCMLMWVLQQQYSPLFMALCVMELPTFFLSVGSIHTPWRHDYLFAATFVATRIVFHGSCLVGAVRTFGISSSITLALAAVLPVHIHWFVGFIEQQKRLYRQKVAEQIKITTEMPPRRSLEVELKGTAVRRVCHSPIFPGSFVSHPAH